MLSFYTYSILHCNCMLHVIMVKLVLIIKNRKGATTLLPVTNPMVASCSPLFSHTQTNMQPKERSCSRWTKKPPVSDLHDVSSPKHTRVLSPSLISCTAQRCCVCVFFCTHAGLFDRRGHAGSRLGSSTVHARVRYQCWCLQRAMECKH